MRRCEETERATGIFGDVRVVVVGEKKRDGGKHTKRHERHNRRAQAVATLISGSCHGAGNQLQDPMIARRNRYANYTSNRRFCKANCTTAWDKKILRRKMDVIIQPRPGRVWGMSRRLEKLLRAVEYFPRGSPSQTIEWTIVEAGVSYPRPLLLLRANVRTDKKEDQ